MTEFRSSGHAVMRASNAARELKRLTRTFLVSVDGEDQDIFMPEAVTAEQLRILKMAKFELDRAVEVAGREVKQANGAATQ